ncbi:heavy metal translocating P-type ATPase [Sulfurihydrogenibium azorense]|uniref:heavy metal translocating P-type ATPase n=1 Tax=Sulfurihydrogenibium azorense TaxID=309806 RepID=UPI0024092E18|nr:heavy metal translocating P-type ATPase [Sulfurihydrogenibium azorense]MDM7273603.1 heavy metal translocating P-type ATPase [Sulfurihydrogenibium azorense]
MPIPYKIKEIKPGKVKIYSEVFKYISVSDKAFENYFSTFKGVSKVISRKAAGLLTLYYNPNEFDLLGFYDFLNSNDREMILSLLSSNSNHTAEKEEERDIFSPTTWFKLNSLAFTTFLFRSVLPGGLFTAITLGLGSQIFLKGLRSVRKGKIDVHLLDSSAILLSSLQGNHLSSLLMTWLLSLGDVIQEKTEKKAHVEIEKLLNYKQDKAFVVVDENTVVEKPVTDVKKGDVIVVYDGQKITVDGVVIDGDALVNQASLTGESNPVHKKVGDAVYAGTFVEDGKLYIKTEKVGDETALAKIVKIIEEAANQPIQAQLKAEEMANKFVIPTFMLGTASYLLTRDLNRVTSTLIIDYHTGIHVSTPLSIMSHMALAARHGILFKSGRHLELLHKVDTIVFDKTGTLTIGHPEVTEIITFGISEEEAIQIAASLEQRITHPVAKSIVSLAIKKGIDILPRKDSEYHIGMGIEGYINDTYYLLGSTRFMEKKKIKISKKIKEVVDQLHEKGESVLYLVKESKIIALLGISDPIKPESRDVINILHKMKREVILCTGDNEGAAEKVAKALGIKRFYARAFPDEKAKIIKKLKSEGRTVAFLGDGVNDAPALSVADIGISIRSGADIAIEVADVVINNNLYHLVDAIKLSDEAIKNVYQNFKINTVMNTVGLVGSVMGIFSPVVSTIINNGTSVLMGVNAIKPLIKDYNHIFYSTKGGDKNG